jgi:hypothetical protein
MSTKNGPAGRLERLTVNLIERASRSLRLSMKLTGDTATDTVNRHLQLGAYFEWQTSRGTKFWIQEPGEKTASRLVLNPGPPSDGDSLTVDDIIPDLAPLRTVPGENPHPG